MIRKILTSLVLAGALVASAAGAQSQDSANRPKDTSRVHTASGEVSMSKPMPKVRKIGVYGDSGVLEGVEVKDIFTGTYALTTSTGTASLSFLTYRGQAAMVLLRKPGFAPKEIVVPNDTSDITEVLERAPLGDSAKAVLPAVVTNAAEETNLEWKRRTSGGQYIAPGVLKDSVYQFKTIAEALAMNQIKIETAYKYRGQSCGMQLLVNGAKSSLDLHVPAQVFTAVEFYPSAIETPEQFRRKDGKDCGTLVLWTHRDP